jgi:cyclophilin family peptidyl-prolyl cis-trans isomerase
MIRTMHLVLLLLLVPLSCPDWAQGQSAPPPAETVSDSSVDQAAAAEAKAAYDQAILDWKGVLGQIEQAQVRFKSANGDQQTALREELKHLRLKADRLIDQIVSASMQVHKAAPDSYPKVNSMLIALGQFFITGDYTGDGGDQYEKALPILKRLLETGAGNQTPELWLWGATSAMVTGDYPLAKQYYDEAKKAGILDRRPPSSSRGDPRNRAWELARQFSELLNSYTPVWQEEQALRKAEALADDLPRVLLTTTGGDILIELFENEAPIAVANFLSLVKQGYYDGLTFHRVLPGFMAQGGCSKGDGTGGPGYRIRCECYGPNARNHFRGNLSMAHAGPNTGGSQFFLTFVPTAFLNGKHTVFGRVIEGIEVASSIRRRDPQSPNPAEADKILKAQVVRDRGHAYQFEKLPER